jgi:PAS domain S-box-containing protein
LSHRHKSRQLEQHKILARISSYFIGDFVLDQSLHKSLSDIGKMTGSDRVYIYRIHHKAKLAHITHEWLNPDATLMPGSTTSFSLDNYGWLVNELNNTEIIFIMDTGKLPSEAIIEKKVLTEQGVKSLCAYPFKIGNKLEGFIGIDYIQDQCTLPEEYLQIMKIAADIIGFSVERKQSEKSLKRTEQLYEKIFENTGAATVTIKPDTTILMVNSEFERLSGYKRSEVEGKIRLVDLLDNKDQSVLRKYHHLLMSNPEAVPKNYEFSYLNRKGDICSAFMTGSSLIDTKNSLISFIDITEFKDVESQLRIAKDKAEESDRLKSAFLANVSHEIRTPLNAITGFSSLLANPNLQLDKKEKYIQQILNGSNELVNLIDNVLDISRIESGTLKPRITEYLLNVQLEEMQEFYNDLKDQHAKESLDIKLNVPEGSEKLLVRTDKMILQQILGSIIENAVKFTSSGSIEYGYSILADKPDTTGDQSLLFFVKDTGIGISKKDKDRVFERFVKIVDKDAYLYRGAGLGLALARDLVQLLGGEIWVESSLGKGSTFYFTIPYETQSGKKDDERSANREMERDWSDKCILVAEDTESNYLYIEELLSPTNARLIRAKDGLEAIEIFRANKDSIDLIFMDILMPEYDGFEATQLIRKIKKDIPVIAQTAFTFEGEMVDGLYAGCFDDYVLKPFNIKVIYKLLGKHLFKES